MDTERDLLVLLHGLGQTPQSWQDQVTALPEGLRAAAPWLHGLRPNGTDEFSLGGASSAIGAELIKHGAQRAHLCGLSVGAMAALQFAVDAPDQVDRLVLCGAQVRPPKSVMWLQRQILKATPAARLAQQGIHKEKAQQALAILAEADFTDRLDQVRAPTLVVCGDKDRANLPASRLIADQVPGAELVLIAGAGNAPNTERPDEFNEALYGFLTRSD